MPFRFQLQPANQTVNHLPHRGKQQGSAIILALFVIIILSLLGSVLMRMLSTSSETVSQEIIGTRAYMAASSAMQGELQRLFPLNPSDDDDYTCNATNSYDFQDADGDIEGLYHCNATTRCVHYHTDGSGAEAVNYYRLTSTGECGSGTIEANSSAVVKSSRTVQVEARSL